MSDTAIETRNLTKRFADKVAVEALNLTVPRGSVYGFLGANGAGKTTTIRMIVGHLHPDEGEALALGANPWTHDVERKRRVAYVSESMNLPGWLTPVKAVQFTSSFYPAWNASLAERLLDLFQLRNDGAFKAMSKGQKQRLCLLLALAQNAELLVLDEPASSLDVVARHDFLSQVLDIACEGNRTVFLSSHLLSDLERVVDRIGIIRRGRLIVEAELESLKASVKKIFIGALIPENEIAGTFRVAHYEAQANETTVTILDYEHSRFGSFCQRLGIEEKVRVIGFNLEDLFVELEKHDRQ